MHSVELSLVDRHIILEILDTAGIDEFPVMRRIAVAHGDAFLIVYAVNDASSFAIARQMRQLVLEIKGDLGSSPVPMVIVGNKCDLDHGTREISRDYAETIVRDQWASTLIETTCHERESVLNAFHQLLHLANINMTLNTDVTRRSSDPNLSGNKDSRSTNKRQSCAQQWSPSQNDWNWSNSCGQRASARNGIFISSLRMMMMLLLLLFRSRKRLVAFGLERKRINQTARKGKDGEDWATYIDDKEVDTRVTSRSTNASGKPNCNRLSNVREKRFTSKECPWACVSFVAYHRWADQLPTRRSNRSQ